LIAPRFDLALGGEGPDELVVGQAEVRRTEGRPRRDCSRVAHALRGPEADGARICGLEAIEQAPTGARAPRAFAPKEAEDLVALTNLGSAGALPRVGETEAGKGTPGGSKANLTLLPIAEAPEEHFAENKTGVTHRGSSTSTT
jgi:hypothetical protein